jgi:hypothetical protein
MKESQVSALFDFLDMFPTEESFLAHCDEKGKSPSKWLPLWQRRQKDLLLKELKSRGVTARQAWNEMQMSKQKPTDKGF